MSTAAVPAASRRATVLAAAPAACRAGAQASTCTRRPRNGSAPARSIVWRSAPTGGHGNDGTVRLRDLTHRQIDDPALASRTQVGPGSPGQRP